MSTESDIVDRWYATNMQPGWKPKEWDDFNPFFRTQLDDVRQTYHLESQGFGVDTSNFLRPVKVRDRLAFVTLHQLDWCDFTTYENQSALTFRADFSLSIATGAAAGEPQFRVVYAMPTLIKFPDSFPAHRPKYSVDWSRKGDRHSKHTGQWDQESYICTLNGVHRWDSGAHSILSAIDVMVDWMGANHFGR